MANLQIEESHPPTKLEDVDKHNIIDLSDAEWFPDYDDAWEVDSDIAFNLDTAAEVASKTDMHLDLEYLPAANPPGCPHVIDLTQKRVINAMCIGECALSRVDILATILYNYDEELLKAFVDLDGYSYVRLKVNAWVEVPLTTTLADQRLNIVRRGKICYKQKNLTSIFIIRALDHVYAARVSPAPNANQGHTMVIRDRYKWKITPFTDEPWVLVSYDSKCHTTSWNICDEKRLVDRVLKGNKYYHQVPISQLEVPWLMDFSAGQDLLDEVWMGVENAEGGYQREVTDMKIEKMNTVQKREMDLVVRTGNRNRI